MVMAAMEKIATAVLDMLQRLAHVRDLFEVQDVGDPEPQKVSIEVYRPWHVGHVEPEVAQSPNLEGPLQHDASHVIGLLRARHGVLLV
jgi:hypothetical protein